MQEIIEIEVKDDIPSLDLFRGDRIYISGLRGWVVRDLKPESLAGHEAALQRVAGGDE